MRTPGTAAVRRWQPLTAELRDTKSPVTLFIKQRFPHVRQIQQCYRDSVGSLLVAGGGAAPGTLGTAFDWAVRFLVHPRPSLDLALIGVAHRAPRLAIAAVEMGEHLGALAPASAVTELGRLCQLARTALLPHLAVRRGPWALGPTFDGSKLMKADADLIAARERRSGPRRASR